MPAQLIALTEGPNILLDKPILLFGRHPECDIQIESRKVSRRHCCIAQLKDYLVVRDLGSTNGVRINGARVLEGRLKVGDELTIGTHQYKVRWDALPVVPLPSVAPVAATPAVRPPGPGPLEDDLLEECDEPVPLADGGELLFPAEQAPAPPPPPPASSPPRPKAAPAPAHDPSLILPDELHLAPPSDIQERPPSA
jgi:pSer/pThr/pTyr-binding forkhead associated (FHA) protein